MPVGRDARQRHFLDEGAVRVARLEAERFELLRDVLDGKLLAPPAERAALVLVGSERADVAEELVGIDGAPGRVEEDRRKEASEPFKQNPRE